MRLRCYEVSPRSPSTGPPSLGRGSWTLLGEGGTLSARPHHCGCTPLLKPAGPSTQGAKGLGAQPTLLRNGGGALLVLQPGPRPVPTPGCMGLVACLRVFPFSPQMAELKPLKAPQFFLNLATPSVSCGLRSGASGTPDFSLSSCSTPRGSGAWSLLAREPCEEGACEAPRPPSTPGTSANAQEVGVLGRWLRAGQGPGRPSRWRRNIFSG